MVFPKTVTWLLLLCLSCQLKCHFLREAGSSLDLSSVGPHNYYTFYQLFLGGGDMYHYGNLLCLLVCCLFFLETISSVTCSGLCLQHLELSWYIPGMQAIVLNEWIRITWEKWKMISGSWPRSIWIRTSQGGTPEICILNAWEVRIFRTLPRDFDGTERFPKSQYCL